MSQSYTFHVDGMHCASCVLLTESELSGLKGMSSVRTSLKDRRIDVTGEFGEKTAEEVMHDLNAMLAPHGYTLSAEKKETAIRWSEFAFALPIALLFVAGFLLLQTFGIVNLVDTTEVSYGTAFIVGLIASISTCMAVVGGIALSVSASFAKEGDKIRPQAMFHAARLGSFFLLGGVIGMLGSVFQLGATGTLVLGFGVAIVLFVLGVNLLDLFSWTKKLQVTMPRALGARIQRLKQMNHTLTPLLLGVATFFLPCGFTQSMQIYTLTTGSFWKGGLTMFVFALGTLPVLALLSFSSLGIHKRAQSGIFFKTAGLIVIFFALFQLLGALAGAGIIDPLLTF